jgi:thiamine-phosphate pyrophosphorylase
VAHQDDRPWFAIGGIETLERLDEVIARGARRAVVVRAITEADDPGAAAAAFAARLRAVSADLPPRVVRAPRTNEYTERG